MRPDLHSDEELVKRAKNGEGDAFDVLLRKYRRRILGVISLLISNPSDAEEVVQETFIIVFRSLEGFRGDSLFFSWLYRIAVNAAKNYLRDNRKHLLSTTSGEASNEKVAGDDVMSTDPDTPESLLAAKEVAIIVSKTLEGIPNGFRLAIVLHEIDGLSCGEISEMMDCAVGTVRSRIFRARKLIARRLAAEPFFRDISGNLP